MGICHSLSSSMTCEIAVPVLYEDASQANLICFPSQMVVDVFHFQAKFFLNKPLIRKRMVVKGYIVTPVILNES